MSLLQATREAWRSRDKLGDGNQAAELAAFLPAALEIQETPPNPLYRWLSLSLLVLFTLGLLWACIGKVNIVATAEGKIIPSAGVKQVQPLEKGTVQAILVREGERVRAGQPLVELDATFTTADKNRLQTELHSTVLRHAVNQALLKLVEQPEGQTIIPDLQTLELPELKVLPEHEQLLHKRLVWQKWQEYRAQQQSLSSALTRVRAEQAMTREVITKLEQTLPIVSKRSDIFKGLFEKSYVSENEYMLAEQERISQTQDLAAERQRLHQLKASEEEVAEQAKAFAAVTSATLLAEIADQQRMLAVLEEELTKARGANERQVLYAPVNGRVQDLAVNTVGGVVIEAQQLMLIVPEEEQLEVEVFLENKDIGFVGEGMQAEIKVHTFPFTKYGVVDAEVVNISDDATVDEKRGLIYRMHLRMQKNTLFGEGREVSLQPGMAVTAEVKTGDRRVVEFFLSQLERATKESVRER
ncbi:HlyD family type I secretion periplasmic adaptor subunit [Pseudomonas jilinensis]|uniref:Membrane fusion protein (MFP) family protein n=1 Tax=Pseudomonas jilinensis TaxID=2078689 RepID=A0A396RZU3_9PSED|nr:HlyD family type I secretion periplasmic adaptor subunit [Pseudomonas jilinensis]RHW22170.1 HlyD family type I secretion periplasmic adaptor subunit [Pseudomonas jilinensis]